MCLATKILRKDEKLHLKKIKKDKDGYLTVYKAVRFDKTTNKYYPLYQRSLIPFKTGLNTNRRTKPIAISPTKKYPNGFHSLLRLQYAKEYIRFGFIKETLVKCKIKKEWIKAMGLDLSYKKSVVIVTSKIIMPAPNDKESIIIV